MEERLRILEMLREGRLSVAEADRLLGALEPARTGPVRERVVRVRVSGRRGETANFTLPLTLLDTIAGFLPKRLRVDDREIDPARLLAEVRESGVTGKILDVADRRGAHIEVTVE